MMTFLPRLSCRPSGSTTDGSTLANTAPSLPVQDTFEDAVDTTSVRSLTNRSRTSVKTASQHDLISKPTSTQDRADTPDSMDKVAMKAKSNSDDEDEDDSDEEEDEEEEEEEEEDDDEDDDEEESDKSFEGIDIDSRSENGTVKDSKRSSKRISSNTMDNVDLDDNDATTTAPPPVPEKPTQISSKLPVPRTGHACYSRIAADNSAL